MADGEIDVARCPGSQESMVPHTASPGNDQNSSFEVCFLLEYIPLLHHSKVEKTLPLLNWVCSVLGTGLCRKQVAINT